MHKILWLRIYTRCSERANKDGFTHLSANRSDTKVGGKEVKGPPSYDGLFRESTLQGEHENKERRQASTLRNQKGDPELLVSGEAET